MKILQVAAYVLAMIMVFAAPILLGYFYNLDSKNRLTIVFYMVVYGALIAFSNIRIKP